MNLENLTFYVFENIFKENIQKRSRTVKGVSDTASSSSKKKLLLEGDSLSKQVEENTQILIDSIWRNHDTLFLTPEKICATMEMWHSLNNYNLQNPQSYQEDLKNLELISNQLRLKYGRNYRINPKYRTWKVSYTTLNIQPIDLEFYMDEFYLNLSQMILKAVRYKIGKAHLLAFADLMIDGEIHPWNDACGRSATAAVMCLSLLVDPKEIPIFGERNEHHKSIHDLQEHTAYFEKCLDAFYSYEC
ncbi:MAG: hypothetical protein AAB522_02495 [Patescibacteria group bacterium]